MAMPPGWVALPDGLFERIRQIGPEAFTVLAAVQYLTQRYAPRPGVGPGPEGVAEFTGLSVEAVTQAMLLVKQAGGADRFFRVS